MSEELFVDFSYADGSAAIGEKTVFSPFSLRFRPFISRRESRKMPSYQAFGASALGNAD